MPYLEYLRGLRDGDMKGKVRDVLVAKVGARRGILHAAELQWHLYGHLPCGLAAGRRALSSRRAGGQGAGTCRTQARLSPACLMLLAGAWSHSWALGTAQGSH